MVRKVAVVVALLVLTGCSNTVERKTVEGYDCITVENFANEIESITCDWDRQTEIGD